MHDRPAREKVQVSAVDRHAVRMMYMGKKINTLAK